MKIVYAITEINASLNMIKVVMAEFGVKDEQFREIMYQIQDGDYTGLVNTPWITLLKDQSGEVNEIQIELPEQRMVTLLNTLTPWIKRFCPLALSIFGMLKVAGNLFMDMAQELTVLQRIWDQEDEAVMAKQKQDKEAAATAAQNPSDA